MEKQRYGTRSRILHLQSFGRRKLFEEWRLLGPTRPANMGQIMALMKRYGYQLVALTWE